MKAANLKKRILAFGLALSLVVTGSVIDNSSVAVAKKAKKAKKAKTPKISKKKLTVTAGKTAKLTVKNASKTVKWSTSNKKVVKVTKKSGKKKSKATLKAVAKGSAKVTAKVGKKKLTCKVTVKAVPTDISSVSVDAFDSSSVVLKMKKVTSLNASDIKVAVKGYNKGTFNKTAKVTDLTTSDQQTWRLYLASGIPNGAYVKVTIGKNVKTVQNKQTLYGTEENETILSEKNKVEIIDLDYYFKGRIGNTKYSLASGKLPDGLVLSSKRAMIKGMPKATGDSTVTIQAVDEIGRKATTELTIKVYDKKTIVSGDQTVKCRIDDYTADRVVTAANPSAVPTGSSEPSVSDTNAPAATATATPIPPAATESADSSSRPYQSIVIQPKGGSGLYTFALAAPADVAGVALSTDKVDAATQAVTQEKAESTTLNIPYGITEGTHTYTINITDTADATRVCSAQVTVNVVPYYNITGAVADAAGNMPRGNALYFIPKDAKSFSEYICQRTYIKYQDDGYDRVRCGGNRPNGYPYDDYNSYGNFVVYDSYDSANVGPFPAETPLRAEPTATPADATPTPVPSYQPPVLDVGRYMTEIPEGEYIVKMYSSATDTYYQMDNTVTVGKADAEVNLNMPIHYATVSGVATYANVENPVANNEIYFEMKDEKAEWDGDEIYSVSTNYKGEFAVSMPKGTYTAYIYDEYGKRQYFGTDVTVGETASALADFKLAITRYLVEGKIYRKASAESSEESSDGVQSDVVNLKPVTGQKLYFYMPDGTMKSVSTDSEGKYQIYLEGGSPAKTYTVRTYNYDSGKICSLGSVSVEQANRTVAANNAADLTMDFTTEAASAVEITPSQLGTAVAFQSTGNNEILAKFTPAEAANYQIEAAYTNKDDVYFELLDASGYTVYSSYVKWGDGQYIRQANLQTGTTYYLRVITYRDSDDYYSDQTKGNISVTISKRTDPYDVTAELTAGTELTVNTSSDSEKPTYIKVNVEANKTYTIDVSNTTIGVKNVAYEVSGSTEYGLPSGSLTNGKGKIVFKTAEAGAYYIKLQAKSAERYDEDDEVNYSTLISANLKLSLTVSDSVS